MMLSFLLHFPTELVCVVLSQWLEPRDVGYLDSAYCKKEERLILLDTVFKSPHCVLRHPSSYSICNLFANWVHIRGIYLCELLITNQTNLTIYVTDMERNGKYVESIKLYKVDLSTEVTAKYIIRIGLLCKNLSSLICIKCTLNESIIEILRHGTVLQDFILKYCTYENRAPSNYEWEVFTNKCLQNVTIDFIHKSPVYRKMLDLLLQANVQRMSVCCKSEMEIQTTLQKVSECSATLRCLSFDFTFHLGEEHVTALVAKCPHILHLSVRYCESFTDECCITVARYLTHLRTLNIMQCNLTDISLLSLAEHRHATLEGLFTGSGAAPFGSLTGVGFNAVFAKCHMLHTVGFSLTNKILGTLNYTLLGNIRTLQLQLYQAECLKVILTAFRGVTNLYVSCPSNVIQKIVLPNQQQLPTLQKFCICTSQFCDMPTAYNISSTSVPVTLLDKFRSQRPNLLVTIEPGENWPSYLMKLLL